MSRGEVRPWVRGEVEVEAQKAYNRGSMGTGDVPRSEGGRPPRGGRSVTGDLEDPPDRRVWRRDGSGVRGWGSASARRDQGKVTLLPRETGILVREGPGSRRPGMGQVPVHGERT